MGCKINTDYLMGIINSNLDDYFLEAARYGKYSADVEANVILTLSDAFKKCHFCVGLGSFMAFDGVIYRKVDKGKMTAMIKHILENKGVIGRYIVATPNKAFDTIANTVGLTDFTPTRSVISFSNGVLDIENGFKFSDPSAKFMTSIFIDTVYDPDAKCPRFDKFLKEILPEEDDRILVQDIFGYMFIDRKKIGLDKMALFLGEGRNGKSVLSDVITGTVGSDNISAFSMYDLVEHPQADYKLAACNGKLMNLCPDMDKKDYSGGRGKAIISGDKMSCRSPHEKPYDAENLPMQAANLNELPITSDQSLGWFRRQLIVKFSVIIDEDKMDTGLKGKILASEKSGVLNWILKGTERVLRTGNFTISKGSKEATDAARIAGNSVLKFLRDMNYVPVMSGKPDFKTITDIYNDYKQYCKDCNCSPYSRDNFKKHMVVEHFAYKRRNTGWGFEYYVKPEENDDGTVSIDVDKVEPEQLPF